jgi:hypothetical protein
MTWPFVIVHATLEEETGGYLQHALDINLQGRFSGQPESVSVSHSWQEVSRLMMGLCNLAGDCHVELVVGGNMATTLSLQPAVEFAHRASDSGCPANLMVIVQMTSSLTTGALLYSSNGNGPAYSMLLDVIKSFIGADMLGTMVGGNAKACMPSRPQQKH